MATRGQKPDSFNRRVDAPRKYVAAPPNVPDEVKDVFDALVQSMDPGFFVKADVEPLIQAAKCRVRLDELEAMQCEPGYSPIFLDQNSNPRPHPLESIVKDVRNQYRAWLTACRMTPQSVIDKKSANRPSPEETDPIHDDPKVARIQDWV